MVWSGVRRASCPGNEPLKQGGSQSASSNGRVRRSQKLLMTAEIALAFVLCIGAGLLTRSLIRLISIPPGFDGKGVLTAQIDLPRSSYREPGTMAPLLLRTAAEDRVVAWCRRRWWRRVLPLRGSTSSSAMTIEGEPTPDLGAAGVFVDSRDAGLFCGPANSVDCGPRRSMDVTVPGRCPPPSLTKRCCGAILRTGTP